MPREIKFRAWNPKTNKWERSFFLTPLGCVVAENAPNISYKGVFGVELELVQFTGLKDKNGKEIYEGDVIESISFAGEKVTNEIIYNEKEGAFTLKSGFLFAKYENEVIGNIYENPELLNH